MKFAMNGALTVGTLDGANVEIREAVGAENFFLFGLTAPEVHDLQARGYRPRERYEADPRLRAALDRVANGDFARGYTSLFRPLVDDLLNYDPYLVLADFAAYADCQARVDVEYAKRGGWARMSILNTARMGLFSSDRAIHEYCEKIWRATSVPAGRSDHAEG
jgi:starch phosphorylase